MQQDALPVSYPGLFGQSWMTPSELTWFIERLPASGLLIEVGTASGVTAAKAADARPGLTIFCVDTFVDHDADHVRGTCGHRMDNWRANARPRMHLFLGPLEAFRLLAPFLRADAVLVDGDHTEDGCYADLKTAKPMVRPGGCVFVHDVGGPDWPGVTRAVERAKQDFGYRSAGRHQSLEALSL